MGAKCPAGEHWDRLIKKCLPCHLMCQQPPLITCTEYCALADCKTLPGHYYDELIRKCVRCADACGKHPAECFQYCHPPVTTKKLLIEVTPQLPNALQIPLEESTVLFYTLLALCIGLLLSSLSLALLVFLRRSRAEMKPQRVVVKRGQGDVERGGHPDHRSKHFMAHAVCASKPSGESRPTETCVCVQCYPEPSTSRMPLTYNQQPVFSTVSQMQNQVPLSTKNMSHISRLETRNEL
ncbi:tumor necrosis factor receptor superfamily member 13B [Corythoichthys intestinalis]|uniref:tumor necrosis factor receptor superfamily member 13B n=1 Tax=Corythoichthys intestinalis TaxID=161448 RepID=UPI0025A5037A|nr:tumor necrosis factor receptor superfamily member 13B [Corythoichthys intestinalis]XP_057683062.1 tumor necrosis factor receptor superfamily member 13B [Corythoichthys intestinalis]XP_061807837.1 tumor necrosis factor receptor superfamily member 13B-like [Nerophis lumbriciformis]